MPEIKPQVYVDPRSPEELAPFHEWARTHEPGWTYAAIRVLLTPVALTLYRTRALGAANVPPHGAFILAPNHFSNMDHFFCCVYLRRQIRFMSKSQFFGNNPVLSYLFRVSGHFPVRRGHNDEEAFVTAHCIHRARRRCRHLRRGWALAQRRVGRAPARHRPPRARVRRPGATVAIHGSSSVRRWRRGRFPRVRVSYGEPLRFERRLAPDREAQLAAARQIFDRVRGLYDDLGP